MSDRPIDLALVPEPRRFWKCRFISAGPWVPVVSFYGPPIIDGEPLDRPPRYQAIVRLEHTARAILFGDICPIECDGIMLRNLEGIEQSEWRYLADHAAYSTAYRPDMPDASPRVKIDRKGRSIF